MNDLLNYRKNAINDGLCKEWNAMWMACHDDKEKLMQLVLMQQSFPHFVTYCNNGKGVSKDFLLTEYKKYINGRVFYNCDNVDGYTYAMMVALKETWTITTDVSYFLWCEDVVVTIPSTRCPTIYVGCTSDVHLALDGFNSVRVHLYDNSRVVIEDADEESNVIVYRYSDDARVECGHYCLCDVKEFRKELRLQL